jgi:hypothetical protein
MNFFGSKTNKLHQILHVLDGWYLQFSSIHSFIHLFVIDDYANFDVDVTMWTAKKTCLNFCWIPSPMSKIYKKLLAMCTVERNCNGQLFQPNDMMTHDTFGP